MPPCDGRLVKVHLVPAQEIRRVARRRGLSGSQTRALVWDERAWVWGCGGNGYGNAGHHGMLDHSKTLRLPREAIPERTEAYAKELGLEWLLDKHYGERATT